MFAAAVLAYAAWAILAWWWSASPTADVPRAHVLGLLELATLAVLAAAFGAHADVRRGFSRVAGLSAVLLAAAAVGGALLAALGTDTPLVGAFGDLEPGSYRRAQAATWHPNLLASLCVFFWVGVAQEGSPWSPRARRLLTALLVLTVILTLSRTLLSFGVALLARHVRGTRGRRLAWLAGTGVALSFVALTLTNLRIDPTRPWEARIEEAPSPRRQAIVTSWRAFVTHPVVGVGPGRAPGEYEGFPIDAHLTPLNLAATLGLPGLVAFAALPLVAWRTGTRERAAWSALVALGLDALTEDVEEFRHLFLLLGFAAARREGDDATERERHDAHARM
jgi:hypothetical protein